MPTLLAAINNWVALNDDKPFIKPTLAELINESVADAIRMTIYDRLPNYPATVDDGVGGWRLPFYAVRPGGISWSYDPNPEINGPPLSAEDFRQAADLLQVRAPSNIEWGVTHFGQLAAELPTCEPLQNGEPIIPNITCVLCGLPGDCVLRPNQSLSRPRMMDGRVDESSRAVCIATCLPREVESSIRNQVAQQGSYNLRTRPARRDLWRRMMDGVRDRLPRNLTATGAAIEDANRPQADTITEFVSGEATRDDRVHFLDPNTPVRFGPQDDPDAEVLNSLNGRPDHYRVVGGCCACGFESIFTGELNTHIESFGPADDEDLLEEGRRVLASNPPDDGVSRRLAVCDNCGNPRWCRVIDCSGPRDLRWCDWCVEEGRPTAAADPSDGGWPRSGRHG